MSVANDILGAVKAVVEAAFPGKVCHVRRASDKNPELSADMDVARGCFAASCNDDRPTEMLWAGTKLVTYPVVLTFFSKELPGQRAPGDPAEDAVAAAARLFLIGRDESGKPGLRGVPAVSDCSVKPLAPYKLPFGNQTANASRIRLAFECIEDA